MKKTKEELKTIESLVKRTYNRRGKVLREIDDVPFEPNQPMGYSYRADDAASGQTIYTVVTSNLGPEREDTTYRIKMHEIGHVYLMHFDDIYEDLDRGVATILKENKGAMVDMINKECGIDYGEDLVNRVLDDPALNHSLHNIAMDFEVNSKVLSNEDIVEMENDVKSLLEGLATEKLEAMKELAEDPAIKEKIDKEIERVKNESQIKLMLPCRYHTKDGLPFPDRLSYPEYLILIIRNLDQFVKMMVNIANGGNGDTSQVTDEQMKEALGNGAQSLDQLMEQMGMKDNSNDAKEGSESQEGKDGACGTELGNHDDSNSGGFKKDEVQKDLERKGERNRSAFKLDHGSPSRKNSDIKRDLGEIQAGGGFGCGFGQGEIDTIRTVAKVDPVDTAIDEVIQRTKSRVIKRVVKRDIIRNYNLGKIRSVIAPSIIAKNRIDKKPRIVYIIDISGSMDTVLVDRILNTIARKMKQINRGLKYDIITWSHVMGEWIKDIEPGKPIPKIHVGGGTEMADAIRFFCKEYDPSATFILISDFEDYLDEWCRVLESNPTYQGWGFNYGRSNYKQNWPKNFNVRNFNESYKGR